MYNMSSSKKTQKGNDTLLNKAQLAEGSRILVNLIDDHFGSNFSEEINSNLKIEAE